MKKEIIKLTEGSKLIYSDTQTLMEKVEVIKVDKKQKSATLSNRVIISKNSNKKGEFIRLDGKPGNCYLLNEETERMYEGYIAYFQIKRFLATAPKELSQADYLSLLERDKEAIEFFCKVSKQFNKVNQLIQQFKQK